MRFVLRAFLIGLVGLGVLLGVGVWLALDARPALVRDAQMSPADVARARRWAADADPRRSVPGVPRVLVASASDVDLLANDAARRLLRGAARVDVQSGYSSVQVSVPVPRVPGHWWMNGAVALEESSTGMPVVSSIHVGQLWMPTVLADFLMRRALAYAGLEAEWRQALGMIETVRMTPGRVRVSYLWRPEFEDRLREGLVPVAMQEQLRAYTERLAELVRPSGALPQGRAVSLAVLVPPLFELARQRSVAYAVHPNERDESEIRKYAASENRAALITLALYAAQRPVTKLVPSARGWKLPGARTVLLGGREDHPQHLLISAVLAAEGGGRLADAVGVYKEISDSKDGSGFSFDDLAADRAGTRLGQRAAHDPLGLQMRLANATMETDFMPAISGLPSFLPEAEFRRRYGRVGSAEYNRVAQEIEARIQKLSVSQ